MWLKGEEMRVIDDGVSLVCFAVSWLVVCVMVIYQNLLEELAENIIYSKELMLIIFPPNANKITKHLIFMLCVVAQILSPAHSQNCIQDTFLTSFTKCQIVLEKCLDQPLLLNQGPLDGYRFKSCSMSKCVTFTSGEECRTKIEYKLEEAQCYLSCCRSNKFNKYECQQNNGQIKSQTSTANLYIFSLLAVCGLGLLLAIVCFIKNEMRCFERQQVYKKQYKGPTWRVGKMQELRCNLCNEQGAIIQTSCKHYFHLECFKLNNDNKPLKGQCYFCDELSSSYRVWCNECQQKYIKINFNQIKTIEQLALHYEESKCLHDDCMKDLNCYVKTDLRLTSTTLD